jgi:hypothetical protein
MAALLVLVSLVAMQVIFRESRRRHQQITGLPMAMVAACLGLAIGLARGAGR